MRSKGASLLLLAGGLIIATVALAFLAQYWLALSDNPADELEAFLPADLCRGWGNVCVIRDSCSRSGCTEPEFSRPASKQKR
jgi:hypothetical protein